MSKTSNEALESANIPLAEYIKEELEARNWTVGDFAEMMDKNVLPLLSGEITLDRDTANQLAKVFDVSADFLLNLDKGMSKKP